MDAAPRRQGGAERAGDWLRKPAGRGGVVALGVVVLVCPLWLWNDPLDGYLAWNEQTESLPLRLSRVLAPFEGAKLIGDDFPYVAGSRTSADLARDFWKPHNAHVVPLFRAWTYLWVSAAGNLAGLARTLALASYLTYLAAMLLIARIVARETGRETAGLAAMAVFGVSAILEETVRWYAAAQAIAAGVCILAMLAALQGWRLRGGAWRLALAVVAAAAAPLVWSVGYIAGPVGAAYLWADGRPRARRWAVALTATSIVVAAAVFGFAGRKVGSPEIFQGRPLVEAANPVQGLISTGQGIVEILVFRNLGFSAESTPAQAVVSLILLAGVWAWTRRRPPRMNPLEAAGLATAVLGFALVYTARGYYAFENLRDLHWYQAVPEMGAVLFAAGWWLGCTQGEPAVRRATTRGGLLLVIAIIAGALALQAPRVREHLRTSVPPMTAVEAAWFITPKLERLRARYFRSEQPRRQRSDFARLDQAEALARSEKLSRAALRAALGGAAGPRIAIGGGSLNAPGFDPIDLLALPENGGGGVSAQVRSMIPPLLTPAPEPPRPWLDDEGRWVGVGDDAVTGGR